MILKSSLKKRECGFSLTEFAIVLGLLGVVVGALWSFANIVRERAKVETTREQVMTVVNNIRSFYSGRNCAGLPGACAAGADLTEFLLRESILLPEMLRDRTAAIWVADHAWGSRSAFGNLIGVGGFSVWGGDALNGGISPDQFFTIGFRGLSRASCITLATKLSSPEVVSGLTGVQINGGVAGINPPPVSPEGANQLCTAPTAGFANELMFVYRLRQPA